MKIGELLLWLRDSFALMNSICIWSIQFQSFAYCITKYGANWNLITTNNVHAVLRQTLCNLSRNLSRSCIIGNVSYTVQWLLAICLQSDISSAENLWNGEFLLAAQTTLRNKLQEGRYTLCNAKKCVAPWPQSLQKVENDSTLCNKNIAWLDDCKQNCETRCETSCIFFPKVV